MKFLIPKRLRFRKEDGFYLVNARWANTMPIDEDIAEFMIEKQKSEEPFDINEFGEDKIDLLANLLFKDFIVSSNVQQTDDRHLKGLSINLDALPSKRLRIA